LNNKHSEQSIFRTCTDGLFLFVRVTPKSQQDRISGLEDFDNQTRLKVRLRALPSDGEANKSLCRVVARWLGVPKSAVTLVSGGAGRNKKLLVNGESDRLKESIENWVKDLS